MYSGEYTPDQGTQWLVILLVGNVRKCRVCMLVQDTKIAGRDTPLLGK